MIQLSPDEAAVLSRPVRIPCGALVRFGPFDKIEDAQVGRLYAFRCHERNPNRLEVGMVTRVLSVNYLEVTCFNHSGKNGVGEWRIEQNVRRSTVLAEVVELPEELRARMVAACSSAPWRGVVEKACGLAAA